MKNFKKMIMGFAAVAIIVAFSAFKGGNEQKKALTYFYGLNPAGTQYILAPGDPEGQCTPDNTKEECTIAYESYPGADSYSVSGRPTPDYESIEHGWVDLD